MGYSNKQRGANDSEESALIFSEEAGSFKMTVTIYQTKRNHKSEDFNFSICFCKNLKF
jgi:hypothetical protein